MEGLSRQGTTTRRLPLPPGKNLIFFMLVFFPVFLRVLKILKEDENENESKRNEKKRKTKRDETRRNRVWNQKKNRNRNRNRKKEKRSPSTTSPGPKLYRPVTQLRSTSRLAEPFQLLPREPVRSFGQACRVGPGKTIASDRARDLLRLS